MVRSLLQADSQSSQEQSRSLVRHQLREHGWSWFVYTFGSCCAFTYAYASSDLDVQKLTLGESECKRQKS